MDLCTTKLEWPQSHKQETRNISFRIYHTISYAPVLYETIRTSDQALLSVRPYSLGTFLS